MWEDLGVSLKCHDELIEALGKAYEQFFLSRANRPKAMEYFDFVVSEAHGLRIKELLEFKERGGFVLGTFCVYVPDEVVTAAGGLAVGLCGGAQISIPFAESVLPRNICPLIKSAFGFKVGRICPYFEAADLLVGETTCDGKKKTWEILNDYKETETLVVPHRKDEAGRALWRGEVRRFAAMLDERFGAVPSLARLKEAAELHNRKRAALEALYEARKAVPTPIAGLDALLAAQIVYYDDAERFTRKVEELAGEVRARAGDGVGVTENGELARILIAGAPMALPNWKLHALIEGLGAVVVCEELCTGTRYFHNGRVDLSGARSVDEALDTIADRYLSIPCACFTPNRERLESVLELVRAYKVDGVVQHVLSFCHDYALEAVRIERALKEHDVPVLTVETDYSDDTGQLRTRLEAFLEMLEK